MRKYLALLLVMAIMCSIVILPVSAATEASYVCEECGSELYQFGVEEIVYDHLRMESCMDFVDPHYHSVYIVHYYAMCQDPLCFRCGTTLYLGQSKLKDRCHYFD